MHWKAALDYCFRIDFHVRLEHVSRREGFTVIEQEKAEVVEFAADGVTPLVVSPRLELTLEWMVESPPPEHTWEEPPIFYDVVEDE